jgi:hypothetical protein
MKTSVFVFIGMMLVFVVESGQYDKILYRVHGREGRLKA